MLIKNWKSGFRFENRKFVFQFENRKQVCFLWQSVFKLNFFVIFIEEIAQSYQMSDKINSHISLMLSVYKSTHQMVKYGWQRNHILQDLTGLEI